MQNRARGPGPSGTESEGDATRRDATRFASGLYSVSSNGAQQSEKEERRKG